MSLAGRCALITGASQGLGFEIAKQYLAAGASIAICARDRAMLERSAAELKTLAGEERRVLALPADISSAREVERLVSAVLEEFGRLEVLVNNAGVLGPLGSIEHVEVDAWIKAVEINLFGLVFLTRRVLPHFKRARYGKIIQLSGGGATSPLPNLSAYAASKAAVVRLIETLAEETRAHGIDVNAIAPGPLNTRMLEEILVAGCDRVGNAFLERAIKQRQDGGVPLARGAELAVFLASGASDGITGKLISALFDPWRSFGSHSRELAGDVYTLRRIVPKDRGMVWGDPE